MIEQSSKSYCTDIKWVGRAHCNNCLIRHLMLFSELPDSAFNHLLQPIDHFLYSSGAVIYQTDTEQKYIYSIRRGMVKLVHITPAGRYTIVRLLGPGTVIGLEILNDSNTYQHSAVAIGQVDLCRIPVSTMKRLDVKYPSLCAREREQIQQQLKFADEWIIALDSGTAKQRVAYLLLVLNEFFTDKKGAFVLLSREDMAAMTGIAVETVSRTIAEFKRQEILLKTNDNLYTCNVPALQKITDSA
jgi:CRP/FNR family transcriptional regulator, anaerobic regulatory protein